MEVLTNCFKILTIALWVIIFRLKYVLYVHLKSKHSFFSITISDRIIRERSLMILIICKNMRSSRKTATGRESTASEKKNNQSSKSQNCDKSRQFLRQFRKCTKIFTIARAIVLEIDRSQIVAFICLLIMARFASSHY